MFLVSFVYDMICLPTKYRKICMSYNNIFLFEEIEADNVEESFC